MSNYKVKTRLLFGHPFLTIYILKEKTKGQKTKDQTHVIKQKKNIKTI